MARITIKYKQRGGTSIGGSGFVKGPRPECVTESGLLGPRSKSGSSVVEHSSMISFL